MNRPPFILSSNDMALTERSVAAAHEYEKNALHRFHVKLSGPIYVTEQRLKEEGIDTSPLETHIYGLVNTQMIKRLVVDLNGMADQLEHRTKRDG